MADHVKVFVDEYLPIAEQVGKKTGIAPSILLAQWGLESDYGRKMPGQFNLGNIKDFSGAGTEAVDSQTRTKSKYVNFESPEAFGDYYAHLIKRRFPEALNAGASLDQFLTGLRPGQSGGYAEDPNYAKSLAGAFDVTSRYAPAGEAQKNIFADRVPVAEQIRKETSRKAETPEEQGMSEDVVDAALIGGGAGAAKGMLERGIMSSRPPAVPRIEAAQERVAAAEDALSQLRAAAERSTGMSGVSVQDLEQELRMRGEAVSRARQELDAARQAHRDIPKRIQESAAQVAAETAEEISSRRVPGSSGSANWTRKMAKDIPDIIAEQAESMRKADPTGGQALIDKDILAKEKIKSLGAGNYELTGKGTSQFMLPPEVAAEKNVAMEAELKKISEQRQQQIEQQAIERRIQQESLDRSRSLAASEARSAAERLAQQKAAEDLMRKQLSELTKGERTLNLARAAQERATTAQPGTLEKIGQATRRGALPVATNLLAGAGTGLSVADAVERYQQGDTSGAVLATLAAALGGMSMVPPAGPLGAAVKGAGIIGGLGMIPVSIAHDYLLKRGPWRESVMEGYQPR